MKSLLLPALILASTLAGCADGVNKHPILNTYFDEIEKGNPVDCNSLVNASDFAGREVHGEEKRINFWGYTSVMNISIENINQCQKEIENHRQAVCSETADMIVNAAMKNKEVEALATPGELTLYGHLSLIHI